MAPSSTLFTVLKLSMTAMIAAWVCIWIFKPTKMWKSSWHVAEARASSTFLDYTGLNMVVFCFPVLAAATMGYVYLHLCSKERRNDGMTLSRHRRIISFMNRITVNCPIGILSGIELLAAALFIVLLAWTFYSNIASDFNRMAPSKSLRLNRWQLKVMYVGVRLGSLSDACLALLLLPVLRGMAVFRIFGIQFESSVRYHVWIGNVMILLLLLHGMIIMFVWGVKNSLLKEITKWQRTGRVNLAGEIALVAGLAIWITSLPPIRRKQFHLFYFVHHLYAIFILFYLLHAGDQHFYSVFSGVLLYALDKVLRIIQSRRPTCVLSARILQCKAVELTLPKHPSMKYTATSVIFVNIPRISKFQWHPFSITSSSNVDYERLTVLVKSQGQWTNSLYNMVYSMLGSGSSQIKSLPIAVEGPYGPPNLPYQSYNNLFLIAGGSGITPFLSIIQDIASRNSDIDVHLTKIQLIYVVKRLEDLSMLTPISPLLLNSPYELRHDLKLKIFVTQEEGSAITAREILLEMSQVKTVILDPTSSVDGLPIPLGLLGKAAITGLSSLTLLASLVCLSHVFVQGKRSSENKIPSWINDMLLICSFVFAASCSVVATVILTRRNLVNEVFEISQKNNAKAEDMHTVEVQEISPKDAKAAEMQFAGVQDVQDKLEINFGKRPNLKDILSQLSNTIEESKIGFFVCGPDSMQRSVASFCRSSPRKFRGNEKRQKCVFTFHPINFSL